MNASEPPTQRGFVTQYRIAAIPPCKRPNASFVHSYGPPSCVNALPTSGHQEHVRRHEHERQHHEPEESLRAFVRNGAERVQPDERTDA